ncbi:unnamed protein product [Allacma fusca]|uniref:Reverse transcriptase/retrotransposon-derived protein RNase H-like domain-containing protein n=1 Tax=Allacma fusca TaxID=39272 RepID=A0A8J2K1M3_9HEXA|nr:unnamed protein product [Allacma fusca]
MYRLLKKNSKFVWGAEQELAFLDIKRAISDETVLIGIDYTKPILVYTDASDIGLGAVLAQKVDNGERPICFASRILQPSERNLHAMEKELIAIIEKLGKEKAHWINTNEPLRRLKGRENQPRKLRSVIIHPKSGIVKVNVCQDKSDDILDLMDTDPIKLPALGGGDKLCHKCYRVGHVAKVCSNPRNKEAYKKKLKDDPVFGEKEKRRIRHNFKEYCRRKRQAAAKKRHCKSSHIRGLEGRSVG